MSQRNALLQLQTRLEVGFRVSRRPALPWTARGNASICPVYTLQARQLCSFSSPPDTRTLYPRIRLVGNETTVIDFSDRHGSLVAGHTDLSAEECIYGLFPPSPNSNCKADS